MSFSDQQACPQIFNIRPINYTMFSLFFIHKSSTRKPSKSRWNWYLVSPSGSPCCEWPTPMPIHHPRGVFPNRNGGFQRGSGNSPGKQGPKTSCFKQINLLETNSNKHLPGCTNHPTMAGVTDGYSWHLCHHPWQNINIGDSWHQLKLVSQNSAWKKWFRNRVYDPLTSRMCY